MSKKINSSHLNTLIINVLEQDVTSDKFYIKIIFLFAQSYNVLRCACAAY